MLCLGQEDVAARLGYNNYVGKITSNSGSGGLGGLRAADSRLQPLGLPGAQVGPAAPQLPHRYPAEQGQEELLVAAPELRPAVGPRRLRPR